MHLVEISIFHSSNIFCLGSKYITVQYISWIWVLLQNRASLILSLKTNFRVTFLYVDLMKRFTFRLSVTAHTTFYSSLVSRGRHSWEGVPLLLVSTNCLSPLCLVKLYRCVFTTVHLIKSALLRHFEYNHHYMMTAPSVYLCQCAGGCTHKELFKCKV